MEWIDVEPVWLLCPELADVFERREAFQGLEALGEVIGVEEGFAGGPVVDRGCRSSIGARWLP